MASIEFRIPWREAHTPHWFGRKLKLFLPTTALRQKPKPKPVWSWYSGMPAALLYCNSIIACAKAIQDVQLEDMGCSVGEYNINALELEDKMCIRKSEKRIEILHENKESSRGRSEKEEGKAGKNKLWMRKVQSTKLGPSRQLLVNILLGKWLEMCSFWTKFTSKSCPNLTHRLTLLHDFSVVVGQTPTKVDIFGNCV